MVPTLVSVFGAINKANAALHAGFVSWLAPYDCPRSFDPKVVPEVKPKVAISDNLGFGGHNAALSFKVRDVHLCYGKLRNRWGTRRVGRIVVVDVLKSTFSPLILNVANTTEGDAVRY